MTAVLPVASISISRANVPPDKPPTTPATGTSVALTASRSYTVGTNYQSFVDVTTLVQAGGNGVYTAGNIASRCGGASAPASH